MANDSFSDHGLIGPADDEFAFGKPHAAETIPKAVRGITPTGNALKSYEITTQVLLESPRPPDPAVPLPQFKELKTAAELAEMIQIDLAQYPDCPKNGFRITVYGAGHWRAMLTITTAAGPVRDPQHWRNLTYEIADRLRQRYELAWE